MSPTAASTVEDFTSVFQALITGSVLDAVTGLAPASFAVRVDGRPDIYVKVVEGGLFCLAGDPVIALGDPAVQHSFVLHVTASGYREVTTTAVIPANAVLPIVVPVHLVPHPVRVQGRVVAGASGAPMAGAAVMSVDEPNPTTPPLDHIVALRTWLRSAYPAGAIVNEEQLPVGGAVKHLTAGAPAGARSARLEDRIGLAVGDLLRFGVATDYEYAAVSGPAIMTTPADAGDVELAEPLDRSFGVGDEVRKVTIAGAGVRHLQRDAAAGDAVVFLDGASVAEALEFVHPITGAKEHHALGALTDADGYYRIDAVGGVATLFLDARVAGPPARAALREWRLNYADAVNVVDFRLTP